MRGGEQLNIISPWDALRRYIVRPFARVADSTPPEPDENECGSLSVRKLLSAFVLPIALNSALSVVMPTLIPVAFVISALTGCYALTRRCPTDHAMVISVVYLPLMLFLLFILANRLPITRFRWPVI